MSDQLRGWLRTVVPAAWSTIVALLVTAGAPAELTAPLGDAGAAVVVPLVLAAVYAAFRKIEPRLPPWVTWLLLGFNTALSYEPPAVDEPDPGRHRAA
ncbi:hypothetical protein AB0H34_37625 [Saccharopolyspora shandongensis]|uniref:hypothetical protein n=1 Tax=Saccharopolyspora shandongensis TaxID=418495 RepID=UPI0033C2F4DD